MPKIKFKSAAVKLYDQVDYEFSNAYGDHIATFTVRYLDFTNPLIKIVYQELGRKSAGNKAVNIKEDEAVRAFVKACVLGWSMEDEEGKPVPFDVDTACEFFADEDNKQRIFTALVNFCSDEANFVQPKDIAGNS